VSVERENCITQTQNILIEKIMWKETGNVHILATGKLLELYEKEYEIEGKRKVFENVRRPP